MNMLHDQTNVCIAHHIQACHTVNTYTHCVHIRGKLKRRCHIPQTVNTLAMNDPRVSTIWYVHNSLQFVRYVTSYIVHNLTTQGLCRVYMTITNT